MRLDISFINIYVTFKYKKPIPRSCPLEKQPRLHTKPYITSPTDLYITPLPISVQFRAVLFSWMLL